MQSGSNILPMKQHINFLIGILAEFWFTVLILAWHAERNTVEILLKTVLCKFIFATNFGNAMRDLKTLVSYFNFHF